MSAVTAERAAMRSPEDPSRPNWEKIGVILAVLAQLGAAVWFASALDRRVTALEAELPAGSIQVLEERSARIEKSLERIEARP